LEKAIFALAVSPSAVLERAVAAANDSAIIFKLDVMASSPIFTPAGRSVLDFCKQRAGVSDEVIRDCKKANMLKF
jgi:hypothetical protein